MTLLDDFDGRSSIITSSDHQNRDTPSAAVEVSAMAMTKPVIKSSIIQNANGIISWRALIDLSKLASTTVH